MRGLQLGDGVGGAGARLRVGPAPLVVLDAADRLLHLAHPALEVLHPVARHLAGRVPAVGDVAERLLGGAQVGDRQQRLRLDEQRLLLLGVGRELARRARRWRRRGRRRTCPGRRGTASRAGRRRPWGPGRRPSTGASGRGTSRRSGPTRSTPASASASTTSFSLTTRALVALLVQLARSAPCGAGCTSSGRSRTAATGRRRPTSRAGGAPSTRRAAAACGSRRCASRCPAASRSASVAIRSLSPLALSSLRARSALRLARAGSSIVVGQRVEPGVEAGEVADRLGLGQRCRAPA